MDPIAMIVTALAAGAAAGLKPTAEQVIKDAYAGVKALIQRKYPKVDLTAIERKPESESRRASVQEDMTDTGADKDQELLDLVKKLLELLEKHAPEVSATIGVDLNKVTANALKIQRVFAEGTGIKVEDGEFRGDIEIGEVHAGKAKIVGNP